MPHRKIKSWLACSSIVNTAVVGGLAANYIVRVTTNILEEIENGQILTVLVPNASIAARPPSPTLSRSSPYVRRRLASMDVILGMLLLDEQMKLKMHSTGSCL